MNRSYLLKNNKELSYLVVFFVVCLLFLSFPYFVNAQPAPTEIIATTCNYPGYPRNPAQIRCSDCGTSPGIIWQGGNIVPLSGREVKEGVDINGNDLCRMYYYFNSLTLVGYANTGAACYVGSAANEYNSATCFYSGSSCTRSVTPASPYIYYSNFVGITDSVSSFNVIPPQQVTFPIWGTNDPVPVLCSWNSGPPPGGTPDFSITSSPPSRSVTTGSAQAASYTVTVTSLNGFSGNVNLSANCPASNPAYATCAFNTNPVNVPSGGNVSASYTVNTTASIPAASYSINITGTAGALNHQAQSQLVVNSAAPPPAATLLVTPSSFNPSLAQGSGSSNVGTLVITNNSPAGSQDLYWTVSDDAPWLDVRRPTCFGCETSGGQHPIEPSDPPLTITINVGALTPGSYSGTITVTGLTSATLGPAIGSPKTIPVTLTVTSACSGPNCAVCDGTWRALPGSSAGTTLLQPVGAYLPASGVNTQFPDSMDTVVIGSDGKVYKTTCNYGGGSDCTWTGTFGPSSIGSNTSLVSPNTVVNASWDVNIRDITDSYKSTNTSLGWNAWSPTGNINQNWGLPFRITGKNGKIWQFRRGPLGGLFYYCSNSPICEIVWINGANSSFSPTTVSVGGTVNISCDYGSRIDAILQVAPFTGANCSWGGWTPGTTMANYTCIANTVGTHTVSCNTSTGTADNICAQSNPLPGSLQVTNTVNGACGTANKIYAYNDAGYGADTFCSTGSASPASPAFPAQGASVPWTCLGSGGGSNASCSSSRDNPPSPPDLIINKGGRGSVTGVSNPAQSNISCPDSCSTQTKTYSLNTSITLTATPSNGRVFTGWQGAICSGGGQTQRTLNCTFVMDTGKSVIANFAVDPTFKEF